LSQQTRARIRVDDMVGNAIPAGPGPTAPCVCSISGNSVHVIPRASSRFNISPFLPSSRVSTTRRPAYFPRPAAAAASATAPDAGVAAAAAAGPRRYRPELENKNIPLVMPTTLVVLPTDTMQLRVPPPPPPDRAATRTAGNAAIDALAIITTVRREEAASRA